MVLCEAISQVLWHMSVSIWEVAVGRSGVQVSIGRMKCCLQTPNPQKAMMFANTKQKHSLGRKPEH